MKPWLERVYVLSAACLSTVAISIGSSAQDSKDTGAASLSSQEVQESSEAEKALAESQRRAEAEALRKRLYSIPPWGDGRALRIPRAPRFGDMNGPSFSQRVNDAVRAGEGEASLLNLDWTQSLTNIEFGGSSRKSGSQISADGGVTFNLDGANISTERFLHDAEHSEILLEGDVRAIEGDASLTAERLHFLQPEMDEAEAAALKLERELPRHALVPRGYVEKLPSGPTSGSIFAEAFHLDEAGRSFIAESLEYDVGERSGELVNASGHVGPLYFSARRLRILGPADIIGEDIWVTTCDRPVPHYRLRMKRVELADDNTFKVKHARLVIGKVTTPLYLPRVGGTAGGADDARRRLGIEMEVGSRSELGFYVNVAQWFQATPNLTLAPRIFATIHEGVGIGFDGEYDFMNNPRSNLFRGKGSFHTLYTTEDRGYTEAYHRQELTQSTVLLAQWEQWYDADFVKDFYDGIYEDRSGPRTFMDITHTRPGQILSGTVAKRTHDFTTETEKLPEFSYHLIERRLGKGFYGTVDGAAGYYDSVPGGIESGRAITMGRLTYDWNVASGINVAPFVEGDATWYSNTFDEGDSAFRGTATAGTTVQTRFQRAYRGRWGFSGFKHIILPSVTMSYRPDSSLNPEDTPTYDTYDDRPGRTRVSSTIDNLVLGRNAETGEIWPVARLTLFQGNDLSHEITESEDYEVQVQIRPRPWWGFQGMAEAHSADATETTEEEDLDRGMAFLFYDNRYGKNTLNARIGFAVTENSTTIYNQEILYGIGYRLSEKWSFGFEHRYDIERNSLVRQSYEVRRRLHKWEMAIRVRDRDSGVDIGFEFNLTDFPGARIEF